MYHNYKLVIVYNITAKNLTYNIILNLKSSLYSKQKDMSRVIEDGIAGRGGPSLRGDHRGGLPERGRGRGVGRGGGLNSG